MPERSFSGGFKANYYMNELYHAPFSHIYIEQELMEDPMLRIRTEQLLQHFPKAQRIMIRHYKDVFNRRHQNGPLQHRSQALILAAKHGRLVYPGAAVCQSMGNAHFYYASSMMNCPFDCEYCYLKGMYPSGHLVIFVNIEDIFAEVETLLRSHPVYLCISYDTDLLAVESLTGYVRAWTAFTEAHPDLSIEIRTKSGDDRFWEEMNPSARNIFAFTLSPDYVVTQYEHRTGSLRNRLRSIRRGLELGFTIRLCFDPMIACPDWRAAYDAMLQETFETIPMDRIRDISVGSFRLSDSYLKNMRRSMPGSAVVQYPYENDHGVYHYSRRQTEEMECFMLERLRKVLPAERIFRWEE